MALCNGTLQPVHGDDAHKTAEGFTSLEAMKGESLLEQHKPAVLHDTA